MVSSVLMRVGVLQGLEVGLAVGEELCDTVEQDVTASLRLPENRFQPVGAAGTSKSRGRSATIIRRHLRKRLRSRYVENDDRTVMRTIGGLKWLRNEIPAR